MPTTGPVLLRACLLRARRDIALAMLSALVRQLAFLAMPWLVGRAVEDGIRQGDGHALALDLGLLALAVVVETIGLSGWQWWSNLAEARLAAWMRESMLDVVLLADAEVLEADTDGYGDLLARSDHDVAQVMRWIHGLASWVPIVTTVVVLVPALGLMHPVLLGVALACAAGLVVVNLVHPQRVRRRFALVSQAHGARTATAEELLAATLPLRGIGGEQAVVDEHHERSARLTAHTLGLARANAAWEAWSHVWPTSAIAAGVGLGGLAVLGGTDLDVGRLTTFALWMGTVQVATTVLVMRLTDRGAARPSAERIASVLALHPGDPAPAATDESGRLVVDRLAVRRVARDPLGPIDLDVGPGEWALIDGPTGSGKSSLLRALAGLAPHEGTVRGPSRRALVPQDPLLMTGTIAENLRLVGDHDGPALLAACWTSGFDEVLAGLPDGLDTVVGERGATLSGGQRLRLALARALLQRPAVLLLDDTTSALDVDTERTVLTRLRAATPDVVVVVAGHRSALADVADHRITLEPARA